MYYSVTASMKDLFFPITVSPLFCYFAVLYNLCFLSALFLTVALWLLPKLANVLLRYKWTVYTQQNSLIPKCPFYYWLLCVEMFFFPSFLYFLLILNLFWSLKRKKKLELLSPFCHVFLHIFFFRIWLLLKVSWFLKCSSVAACGVYFSFPSLCLFNT